LSSRRPLKVGEIVTAKIERIRSAWQRCGLLAAVQLPIINTEVARQTVAHDRAGMDQGNFLCKHTNIDGIAPKILVGVDTKSVASAPDQVDVTLEADIRKNHLRPGVA